MTKQILNYQVNIYQENYLKHGNSPEGVFNNNKETQELRFDRLLKNINTKKKFSIHDVGAGTCSLHTYLQRKKIDHTYYGSEIVKEMVLNSRKKYPDVTIHLGNILTTSGIKKCDWVISSGTFNIKGKTSRKDWMKYIYQMIEKMFEISNHGIAFNLLTSYNTFESDNLAYFNPQQVFDFCNKNLSRYVNIDHSYPLYEFTTTVYKSSYMKKLYSDDVYAKYFKNDR